MRECFDVVGGDDVDDKRQEEVFSGSFNCGPGDTQISKQVKIQHPISGLLWLNHKMAGR